MPKPPSMLGSPGAFQAPASRDSPSAQARKGRRLEHNQRKHYAIFKELAPFRNWTLGTGREAGSWGRDEVRNIRGAIPPYDPGRLPAGIERGAFCQVEGGGNVPIGASGQRFYHVLDISCVVPTGPQNVPQHVWQPIILYLGRPK